MTRTPPPVRYLPRHIAIVARDLRRLVAFYTGVLDFGMLKSYDIASDAFRTGIGIDAASARGAHLAIPGTDLVLELMEFENPPGKADLVRADDPGYRHIAFWVEDLEGVVRRLSSRGAAFITEQPILVSGVARVSPIRFIYMKDPEGNIIEFNERPSNWPGRVPAGTEG